MKITPEKNTAATVRHGVPHRGKTCREHALKLLSMSAAAVLLPGFAVAQTSPQTIEKIEVTGSNIKRVDAETASPIQIITADDIKRSGKQTITELLLRDLPSTGAGGLNDLAGAGRCVRWAQPQHWYC
jgi:outer membrane receptor for ferrienterochelin and colicin